MKTIQLPARVVGLSDGLSIPCSICYHLPEFDYGVEDEVWNFVVPKRWRTGVICLACFDKLCYDEGINVGECLEFVQFTGREKTIILKPVKMYLKGKERRP